LGGGGGGGRSSNSACSSASVTSELSLLGTFMVGVEEDGFSPESRGTPVGLGLEVLDKPGWNDLSVVAEIGLPGEVVEVLPVTRAVE
jgi:hypothetical protein